MPIARRLFWSAGIGALLLAIFAGGWIVGRLGLMAPAEPSASLTELERQFAERMRDVTMAGSYTVSGQENQPAKSDRRDIVSVEKIGDDLWRFNTRMQCCGVDGAMPVVVPMRWVGDTPVIMLTDASLPGLGKFTVRVFFYGDRYAGTWQHVDDPAGGFLFGRIEPRAKPSL
jgi:hypothetical protein